MFARRFVGAVLSAVSFLALTTVPAQSNPLNLILPTSNRALLEGDGPSFYQYTDRYFDGKRSRPWQGGMYGFVRNPRHTNSGIVYTRMHEGVDIQPLYRDRRGEPLDTVRAVDNGYVVYANANEQLSSYGKYVVVEHWWNGSPFYSLYAHLNEVSVKRGDRVFQGDRLGRLGYTGRGLDRRRAHLHFEINMLLNRNFGVWYDQNYRARNRHDVFNGINLAGIDVAELYLALQADPNLTIQEFITSQEPFYQLAITTEGRLDLLDRYDWLQEASTIQVGSRSGQYDWIVTFSQTGVPIRVEPAPYTVSRPEAVFVRNASVSYDLLTNQRVGGNGSRFHLTESGKRYAALLAASGSREDVVDFDRSLVRYASQDDARLRTW